MDLPEGLHRGVFDVKASTLVFTQTVPSGLTTDNPYIVDRFPIEDLGAYFKDVRGIRSLPTGMDGRATMYNVEARKHTPCLVAADSIYRSLGGKMLLYSLSESTTRYRNEGAAILSGTGNDNELKKWFIHACKTRGLTPLQASIKAGVRRNTLHKFQNRASQVHPLTLRHYLSTVLDVTVEYCAIQTPETYCEW